MAAGFTVGKAQNSIQSPEGLREFKSSRVETPKLEPGDESFANTLNNAFNQVNDLQANADVKVEQLATGKTNNIPEVMLAVEKADIAMKLMMSIRNKMIDAYQEVMKMQI